MEQPTALDTCRSLKKKKRNSQANWLSCVRSMHSRWQKAHRGEGGQATATARVAMRTQYLATATWASPDKFGVIGGSQMGYVHSLRPKHTHIVHVENKWYVEKDGRGALYHLRLLAYPPTATRGTV